MDSYDIKNDLTKIDLTGKNIFKFETIKNINIYVVYKQNKSKINQIIEFFEQNYDFGNSKLYYTCETIKRNFNDIEMTKTPDELSLAKLENIRISLTPQKYIIKKPVYSYDEAYIEKLFNSETPTFEIFIRTYTGKTRAIKVTNNYRIKDIKLMIFKLEGVNVKENRMIFAGKMLENKKTLKDYNIQRQSTLHMVLSLRGGMYHETSGKSGNYQPLKTCVLIMDD